MYHQNSSKVGYNAILSDQLNFFFHFIAKHPNVYMKLSGMVVLAEPWSREIFQPYIDHSIKEFGVKR